MWVNIGSHNGVLPDGTKPLPELALTNHKCDPVTFTWNMWKQNHKRYLIHQSLKLAWKSHHLNKGQCTWLISMISPSYHSQPNYRGSGEARGVWVSTPTPQVQIIGAISLLFKPSTLSSGGLISPLFSPAFEHAFEFDHLQLIRTTLIFKMQKVL